MLTQKEDVNSFVLDYNCNTLDSFDPQLEEEFFEADLALFKDSVTEHNHEQALVINNDVPSNTKRNLTWLAFLEACRQHSAFTPLTFSCLENCIGAWEKTDSGWHLRLETESHVSFERLNDHDFESIFSNFLIKYLGEDTQVNYEVKLLVSSELLPDQIKNFFEDHPDVKALKTSFEAYLVDWGSLRTRR